MTSTEIASGVRVYRAAEAPLLSESGTTTTSFEAAPNVQEVAARLSTTDCSINKVLAHQGEGEGDRISVVYLYFSRIFRCSAQARREQHVRHHLGLGRGLHGHRDVAAWGLLVRPGRPFLRVRGRSGRGRGPRDFSGRDQVAIILTDAAADRLEAAEKAVRENAESWKQLTEGPLFEGQRRQGLSGGRRAHAATTHEDTS